MADEGEAQTARKSRMKHGAMYLAASVVILLICLWLLPEVFGFDFAAFMRGESIVAFLRIALGVVFLFVLAASIRYVISSFTLDGETWCDGLKNAMQAHILSRDGVSVVLLAVGGIALIAWGLVDLIG